MAPWCLIQAYCSPIKPTELPTVCFYLHPLYASLDHVSLVIKQRNEHCQRKRSAVVRANVNYLRRTYWEVKKNTNNDDLMMIMMVIQEHILYKITIVLYRYA